MELHERLVSALMGAIWGAVLGVLVALFLHYVVGNDFDQGFLILDWKNVIIGSAGLFAALGLIFKASVATAIGAVMNWVWGGILRENSSSLPVTVVIVFALIFIWCLY
jgi:hypothetical protein